MMGVPSVGELQTRRGGWGAPAQCTYVHIQVTDDTCRSDNYIVFYWKIKLTGVPIEGMFLVIHAAPELLHLCLI